MRKRADKIRSMRRSISAQNARVSADLKRAGLTKNEVFDLRRRILDLDEAQHDLEFEETWLAEGHEWAQDDHPHAIHARALAVGAQANFQVQIWR